MSTGCAWLAIEATITLYILLLMMSANSLKVVPDQTHNLLSNCFEDVVKNNDSS
jgi:hypothetical protein